MVAKIFDLLMKEHDLHLGDNPHLYVLPHDQITKTAATIKVDDTRSRGRMHRFLKIRKSAPDYASGRKAAKLCSV